jgi:hypothetical protein
MTDRQAGAVPTASLAQQVEFARRLTSRLERLSADSVWAHRASGLRGSLLRWLDAYEQNMPPQGGEARQLDQLVRQALEILTQAAREIRES